MVDLIVKMGYGGTIHDAGEASGKRGDEVILPGVVIDVRERDEFQSVGIDVIPEDMTDYEKEKKK